MVSILLLAFMVNLTDDGVEVVWTNSSPNALRFFGALAGQQKDEERSERMWLPWFYPITKINLPSP